MASTSAGKGKAKPRKDWSKAKAGSRFYVVLPPDVLALVQKEARQLGSQRSAPQHVVISRLRQSFEDHPVKEPLPHA